MFGEMKILLAVLLTWTSFLGLEGRTVAWNEPSAVAAIPDQIQSPVRIGGLEDSVEVPENARLFQILKASGSGDIFKRWLQTHLRPGANFRTDFQDSDGNQIKRNGAGCEC
ncbi:unnamed protein product [Allacma fusca]|uniref:Uncharacterized protein n=1 Tax=Allacma fusca TaxID=39272 RepID=A0A8J2JZ13_9HEXA|nr:unnamed protein product [Allacma fusca]